MRTARRPGQSVQKSGQVKKVCFESPCFYGCRSANLEWNVWRLEFLLRKLVPRILKQTDCSYTVLSRASFSETMLKERWGGLQQHQDILYLSVGWQSLILSNESSLYLLQQTSYRALSPDSA